MGWRDKYKVHPAADVFPMLSDDELKELGEDIKANGLKEPIWFHATRDQTQRIGNLVLIDGRNRLEAIERAGIHIPDMKRRVLPHYKDAVSHIISLNIHRRHLTKQEQADLIVAALKAGEKPVQAEPVSGKVCIRTECGELIAQTPFDTLEEFEGYVNELNRGGRGKVNAVKAKAVAAGAQHDISESTIKRAIAKAEGKTPKRKAIQDAGPYPTCSYEVNTDPDPDLAARRRRGILHMCDEAVEATKHHHFENIPPEEIDMAIINACLAAATEWQDLGIRLSEASSRRRPATSATAPAPSPARRQAPQSIVIVCGGERHE